MRAIEQALRDEGYSPGTVDGVADDDTREAIRAFQQDSGFTESGMVDEQTADSLGVQIGWDRIARNG
jgi:peptidoglycan hydrolase-like protein with peptidoglycan-binding domain